MCPNFLKVCKVVKPKLFFSKVTFYKISQYVWATFVRKFVIENFQKLSNLVTLNEVNDTKLKGTITWN